MVCWLLRLQYFALEAVVPAEPAAVLEAGAAVVEAEAAADTEAVDAEAEDEAAAADADVAELNTVPADTHSLDFVTII